jgi:hypothetical protein
MIQLFPRPHRAKTAQIVQLALFAGLSVVGFAQPAAPVTAASSPQPSPETAATPAVAPDLTPPGGNRVLGVLPNYRTADKSQEDTTISARHKLLIASKDSFDYPLVGIAAFYAAFGQASNQNPSFGQGMKGYGKRLGWGYVDQAMGNMFSEGLFPAMLKEDPRYFRRGEGPAGRRLGYAISRIFITKTDAGTNRFNYSEWMGNASAVAISNTYYPDGRSWTQNTNKLLTQCGTDALSQVLKEFWPDLKKKLTRKSASH